MRRIFLVILCFALFSSSVIAETIRYDRGERRDPFLPLVGPEGIVNTKKFDPTDINIEGIIYDPRGESMVLINGEFYKQGDNVKNANIISIFEDRIILGQSDEQKTIWIREEIVSPGAGKDAGK